MENVLINTVHPSDHLESLVFLADYPEIAIVSTQPVRKSSLGFVFLKAPCSTRHKWSQAGLVLVDSIELTDKCSRLCGPPPSSWFCSHTSTDLGWFWPRLVIESSPSLMPVTPPAAFVYSSKHRLLPVSQTENPLRNAVHSVDHI